MPRSPVLVLALALLFALSSDSSERERTIMRLVPELEPQVARHLVHDTEAEYRAFCREIGRLRTGNAVAWLHGGIRSDSREVYVRTMRELYPYLRRAADALSYEYDRPELARIYQFRASLAESSWAHRLCLKTLDSIQGDETSKLAIKVERYRALAARFMSFGDERELMNIEGALAADVMEEGLFTQRVRLLRSALARAKKLCEHHVVCQLLGEMSDAYARMGHSDSSLACLREGVARADRYYLLDQAARLRLFLARHYFEKGRLGVSAEMLKEALAVNRRYGGDPMDIRPLLDVTEYYARYGCWDLVERNTERLPVLFRQLERNGYLNEVVHYQFTARRLRAMCLAAKGRASEAADSLGRLSQDARGIAVPMSMVRILSDHAAVLLRAGRASEARVVAEDGIAYTEDRHLHAARRTFGVLQARAAVREHRPDLAAHGLAHARRVDPDEPPLTVKEPGYILDGIQASIALERGDADAARGLIRQGLRGLRDSARTLDRGPQTDLTMMGGEDVWLAGHSLLASAAHEDLLFERRWRSLVTGVGSADRVARVSGDRVTVPPGTIQLVYAVMPEGIVRWTALPGRVRREVLALEPEECRVLVERVFEQASSDPPDADAPMPDRLVELAERLGRELLPDEIRQERFDQVSISAEGPLGRLAFELLDASPGDEYLPLLSRSEVRYMRHVPVREQRDGGVRSVILADPVRSTSRRGPGALAPLSAVDSEVVRATAILPNANVIRGGTISKPALQREWERASAVYVAAHLVRDPDAPLFNYFPFEFGAGSSTSEDHYIDISDVRDTDLSRCRLVVLSSCASGEPYVAGTRSGPSMADAFLDAGAEAVIHTRWRVRDESAAVTAPRLTAAWRQGDGRGWRAARLDLMRGRRGIRHPFQWAAWSVTTAVSVPEWSGADPALTASRKSTGGAARVPPAATVVHGR